MKIINNDLTDKNMKKLWKKLKPEPLPEDLTIRIKKLLIMYGWR